MAVELILRNGRIVTLDGGSRVVSALAAAGGRIVALGPEAETLAGPGTEIVDLAGRTAIPGIVDSHCHPDSWAARLARWHDLSPRHLASKAALLARIDAVTRAAPAGAWFAGYRYDERKSGGYPSIAELDRAANGRPLFILRTDGHLGLANSAACALCAVTAERPDPPFGRFDRDPATGALTGLMRETAAHLFLAAIHADDSVADIAEGLERVFAEFLSYGITSVHNSLTSSKAIRAYQAMRREARLQLRVGILASGREAGLVEAVIAAGMQSGFGDEWLRLVGVEWCPDCSTSGRTAAYYAPYEGKPVLGEPVPNTGMLLYDEADMAAKVTAAHRAGLQVGLDGVGDRGIDFCLDAMEAALAAHPATDHRMRIEHCCCVPPSVQKRMERLGVVCSSASGFMYELGDAYAANRPAEDLRWMWPHRSLLERGVPVAGHSDAAICHPNPFLALWSMVNRRSETGTALGPEEAIGVEAALRCYTSAGAWLGREEGLKGTLELGKLADIAVLDRDLMRIPADGIRDVEVDITIVGGIVRYRR